MKKPYSVLRLPFFLLGALLLAGCSLLTPSSDGVIQISTGLGSARSASSDLVDIIELRLEGPGMTPLVKTFNRETETIQVAIPAGPDRHISLKARPQGPFGPFLSAETTVDLVPDAGPVTVVLNLALDFVRMDLGDPDNISGSYLSTINSDHAGYTGQGFMGQNNQSGAFFAFPAPIDFSQVRFRYAANSTNPGEYAVKVNGSGPTALFPLTGSWTAWEMISLDRTGVAGNSVTVEFGDTNNDGGMNADYVEFIP